MEKNTDIVIVGGGLASFAAAVHLAESGREVILVRKAPGATALSHGAWELAAPLESNEILALGPEPSISQNRAKWVASFPEHPFTALSADLNEKNAPMFFKDLVLRAVEEFPLAWSGDVDANQTIFTELGTVHRAAFVQSTVADAHLHACRGARVLLVGVTGYPQFRANFLGQALRSWQARQSQRFIESVDAIEVTLPSFEGEASLSAVSLASALEREEILQDFIQVLQTHLENRDYTHLWLPPILGIRFSADIVKQLSQALGLKVAEVLPAPGGVPGWRVHEAIQEYFRRKEYDILEGEAVGYDAEGKKITSIRVHQGKDRIRLRAKTFILATGKYLSGGIRYRRSPQEGADSKTFKETLFGLPLFCEGQPLEDLSLSKLFQSNMGQAQAVFRVGLKINVHGQVLNREGRPVFENVFAAGRILQGWDPTRDACAAGVDLLSGTVAAQGAVG